MTSICVRCEDSLRELPCGCWVDVTRRTRWCRGTPELHQPTNGTQSEYCPGIKERA